MRSDVRAFGLLLVLCVAALAGCQDLDDADLAHALSGTPLDSPGSDAQPDAERTADAADSPPDGMRPAPVDRGVQDLDGSQLPRDALPGGDAEQPDDGPGEDSAVVADAQPRADGNEVLDAAAMPDLDALSPPDSEVPLTPDMAPPPPLDMAPPPPPDMAPPSPDMAPPSPDVAPPPPDMAPPPPDAGPVVCNPVPARSDEICDGRDTDCDGEIDEGCNACPRGARVPAGWVCVPSAEFLMGSPADEPGRAVDESLHRVRLTRAFLMKATEVTQGEWAASGLPAAPRWSDCGDDCPMERVSWLDAIAYANWLSRDANLRECYDTDDDGQIRWFAGLDCGGYRLPTEAEWEHAARAGTATAFFTGDIVDLGCNDANVGRIAWYCGNADDAVGCDVPDGGSGTHRVARKRANPFGLYDMHGNVYEWVWDRYEERAFDDGAVLVDPIGPAVGGVRVNRGGGWCTPARNLRAANRENERPQFTYDNLGFRLVRSILIQ